MNPKRVGILVFPDVEVLDFCGPYEVFSVARLDEERRREEPSPFEVRLVAEHESAIRAAGGLRVIPDCTLATCPPLEILLVPGGWGTRREMQNDSSLPGLMNEGSRSRPWPQSAPARCSWVARGCWTGEKQPHTGLRSTSCRNCFPK